MENPKDLRYTKDHEWVRPSGDAWRIGITHFAQRQLGDVVFVEVAFETGKQIERNEAFGSVESVKAVSETYAPISGTVGAINPKVSDEPELLNTDPYGDGWIVEIKPSNKGELDELLTADQYADFIKQEESE